jgi:hypothetical protein
MARVFAWRGARSRAARTLRFSSMLYSAPLRCLRVRLPRLRRRSRLYGLQLPRCHRTRRGFASTRHQKGIQRSIERSRVAM